MIRRRIRTRLAGDTRRALPLRIILAVLLGCLIPVGLVVLRPAALGGPAGYVIVVGQSMEPTLHAGDLVVTQRHDRYQPGDVIAYRIPAGDDGAGTLVIHRVIGGSAGEGYRTQGDNRDSPDFWRPKPTDIVGKRWALVPSAGTVLRWLRTPIAISGAVALTAFCWIALPRRQPSRTAPGTAPVSAPLPPRPGERPAPAPAGRLLSPPGGRAPSPVAPPGAESASPARGHRPLAPRRPASSLADGRRGLRRPARRSPPRVPVR
ncbi:MAG: signal peptidase I [Actinobacteria bacterium]|nr:signal peptidase I [Actinomycetota bacterium]